MTIATSHFLLGWPQVVGSGMLKRLGVALMLNRSRAYGSEPRVAFVYLVVNPLIEGLFCLMLNNVWFATPTDKIVSNSSHQIQKTGLNLKDTAFAPTVTEHKWLQWTEKSSIENKGKKNKSRSLDKGPMTHPLIQKPLETFMGFVMFSRAFEHFGFGTVY